MRSRRLAALLTCTALVVSIPVQASAVVVGGHPATRPYEFMVSVQVANGQSFSHNCGGSLVAPRWVLTAAHCAAGDKPSDLQVMIGSQNLAKPKDEIALKKIIVHETYEATGVPDIALLKLARKVSYRPISIVDVGDEDLWAPGVTATAIGWGSSFFLVGPAPDELQEVELPIVSDEDCEVSNGPFGFDPSAEVCAGELEGGKDTCQGDSGGPLMVEDTTGELVQMGVVSWGMGCAFPLLYGVYARIGAESLHSWISSHIN